MLVVFSFFMLINIILIFFYIPKHLLRLTILILSILFIYIGSFALFSDDYPSYVDFITGVQITPHIYPHIESIWIYIGGICNGNIFLFRFITVSVILLLFFLILQASDVGYRKSLFYFFILSSSSFICWLRMPIAIMCFFLAYIMLLRKKWIMALFLFVVSSFLHKVFILQLCVLPFMYIRINKKTLLVFLFILISPYIILNNMSILSNIGINSGYYLEHDSIFNYRNIYFMYSSYITTFLIVLLIVWTIFKTWRSQDFLLKNLSQYLYGVLFISMFFMLLPIETTVIYKRVLSFSFIPMCLSWSKCIKGSLYAKDNIWLPLLLFAYIINTLLYLYAAHPKEIFLFP